MFKIREVVRMLEEVTCDNGEVEEEYNGGREVLLRSFMYKNRCEDLNSPLLFAQVINLVPVL